MYNPEIKERFLAETSENHNFTSGRDSLMGRIGRYEWEIQKDLSQMSKLEAIESVRNARITTYNSATSACTLIKNYAKWCRESRVFENVNPELFTIVADDIDASDHIGRTLFKNEADFIQALRLTRPFDDGYYDVVIMVFAWLGINMNKAMRIKINEVDFERKVISVDGNKEIPFSDELGEILLMYSKTKTGTRLSKNGLREVYRDDSFEWFIRKFCPKGSLGKELTKLQVTSLVHDMNQIYIDLGNEPRFTVGNVLSSGAMYRIWKLEQSGVDVFSIKNKVATVNAHGLSTKLYEILWMYRNYKRAFKL